jgi:hypothetical protein
MRFHVRALLAIGGFIVATSPAVRGQDIDSASLEQGGTTASMTGDSSGGRYVSILVCGQVAEAGANDGPTVAYFERTEQELAACMTHSASDAYCAAAADIVDGMPCAEAIAGVSVGAPEFLELQTVQSGRLLIIIAEDVEGEALATLVPQFPYHGIVYLLGNEAGDGALVGCDFFSRPNATLTLYKQESGNNGATTLLHPRDQPTDAPTCAETLTLLTSQGVPLRAKVSASPRVVGLKPDVLIRDEPATTGSDAVFERELAAQFVRRYIGTYHVTTVTHRVQ